MPEFMQEVDTLNYSSDAEYIKELELRLEEQSEELKETKQKLYAEEHSAYKYKICYEMLVSHITKS